MYNLLPDIYLQYFVSFLQKHRGNPEPSRQYIEWCLDNCNHVHTATRKNPPSTVEITVHNILTLIQTSTYITLDSYFIVNKNTR